LEAESFAAGTLGSSAMFTAIRNASSRAAPAISLPIRSAACSALGLASPRFAELSLALYRQHIPSRRHFLKFLFVTRVHQCLGKLPTFFGVPVVL